MVTYLRTISSTQPMQDRSECMADLALSNDLQEFFQLAGFYVYMVSSSPNQNFHQNISNCHRYCGEINIKNVAIY